MNLKNFKPDYTQTYVADIIGVARTTYTAYENGTKLPPIDTLASIAQLFNVSTDYLIGLTDKKRILQEFEETQDIDKQLSFLKENISNTNNYTFGGQTLSKGERIALSETIDFSLRLIKKMRQQL
ncbi:helix-turn-helix domain-containing protein (plasmid) [Lysinibacillus fusiformis]|nr:helix-turn-helix transcriptional regulator [Lysinibacillus fusiformis]UXJ71448.1 helix-turn-helix domain-containing protein [Lysinibacillus fusiformis]